VCGYLAERGFDRRYLSSVVAMAAGLMIIYACGATWLGLFARAGAQNAAIGLQAAVITGVAPFLIVDAIKLAAAAGIVPGLWALIGQRR
jgi:biotin transport system substrate-specific component